MTLALFTVVDLETAGLEPPASILEVGWSHLYLDTDTRAVEIKPPRSRLFRPKEDLSPENIAIHHLTPKMLAAFEECSDDILAEIIQEDRPQFIVAANSDFEKKWLDTPEIIGAGLDGKAAFWICTVKASARLYPDADSHSNQAMRYRLGLDLPDELAMPPHRAGPDSYVTAHILARFLSDGVRVRDLVQWEREPRFMTRIRFGKHKGAAWADLPIDYLEWCERQTDMDPDARHWISVELERRRNAA